MKKKGFILFRIVLIAIIAMLSLNHVWSKVSYDNRFSNFKKNSLLSSKEYRSIPVLMYHSISNDEEGLFVVCKEEFEKQMNYLKNTGFKTLTLDELFKYFRNNEKVPQKSVVITFDDGYEDNYTNAYPILRKNKMKATVFVVTNCIDKGSYYMNSNQLKEIQNTCIDVQSHTLDHSKLDKLSYEKQVKELKGSKSFLEKLLNKKVEYLAYPFGRYNDNTLKAIDKCNYKMAFTTRIGWSNKKQGLNKLNRIYIPGYMNLELFKKILN
ncbi:polysaccharide deacetylase family protein [Haloimpatiens sp. FM7330]|uniref:polysaccharide deacetylase family protein n=1 Tax=Haloimpatiens sp. FM7330 TaxID=3298610 RepID=UPI0036298BA2